MGLLNNIMCSAICNELSELMIVYVDQRHRTGTIEHTTYLDLAELEYQTLCRGQKWTKSKTDPVSRLYINDAGAAVTSGYNHIRASDDSG